MNDKFKELSALAQEKLIDPITGEEYYSFSRMKFAELIVKECMNICKEGIVTDNDWDHSYWDQACENRATAIQKHFGVEE